MVAVLRNDLVKWEPLGQLFWKFAESNERIPLKLMQFQACIQCLTYEGHACILNKLMAGCLDGWIDGWINTVFLRELKLT